MPMAVSMAEFPPSPLPFEPIDQSEKSEQKRRLRDFLKFDRWRLRDSQTPGPDPKQHTPPQTPVRPVFGSRISRKGLVGIPRSTTFKRQEEEQRKNLTPVEPTIKERREGSQVRQRALSAVPEPPRHARKERSVPENFRDAYSSIAERIDSDAFARLTVAQQEQIPPPPPPPPQPPPDDSDPRNDETAVSEASCDDGIDEEIMEELKKKWILNLSMHFRDKSPREKFFLTYTELPERWRRVTVSCDYRDAPLDSLEHDLQNLHYQKDKSARIYESIRMSLPDIQFYDTVTNLKLETKADRLHVHVTEDINEIIPYPHVQLVKHLTCAMYKESELHFDEHMSGFVYRVTVGVNTWIKKEIPGPDSVDEFLYEVNALSELIDSKNVVQLKGLVVDNDQTLVKGLLLGYAEKGALIDVLYDSKEGHIPHVSWERREIWAKQIIQGLSNIHEAGFVQGDFTLSNIVIDDQDGAHIIDINRRGCPVGWESPEMVPLVESGQRLSMYIGVKSDLYQLGMVLWALAMEKDEPERAPRPLHLNSAPTEVPKYYKVLTEICLNPKPKERFSAKDLLAMFEEPALFSELHRSDNIPLTEPSSPVDAPHHRVSGEQREITDILGASFRDKDSRYREISDQLQKLTKRKQGHRSETRRASSTQDEESLRGRQYFSERSNPISLPLDGSPPLSMTRRSRHTPSHLRQSSFANRSEHLSPGRSDVDDPQVISITPTGDREWEEVNMDGTPYLIHRDTLDDFDGFENVRDPRRGNGVDRWRHHVDQLSHVDSGLGDMDLSLTGVGEHAIGTSRHDTDLKDIPEGITVNLGDSEHPGKGLVDVEEQALSGFDPSKEAKEEISSNGAEFKGETTLISASEGCPPTPAEGGNSANLDAAKSPSATDPAPAG